MRPLAALALPCAAMMVDPVEKALLDALGDAPPGAVVMMEPSDPRMRGSASRMFDQLERAIDEDLNPPPLTHNELLSPRMRPPMPFAGGLPPELKHVLDSLPDGAQVEIHFTPDGRDPEAASSALPAEALARMFPAHVGPGPLHDPFLNGMMRQMDNLLAQTLHETVKQTKKTDPCEADLAALCEKLDTVQGPDVLHVGQAIHSPLHCLGEHAQQVSQTCAQSLQGSVPFACHQIVGQCTSARLSAEECVRQIKAGERVATPACVIAAEDSWDLLQRAKGSTAALATGQAKVPIPKQQASVGPRGVGDSPPVAVGGGPAAGAEELPGAMVNPAWRPREDGSVRGDFKPEASAWAASVVFPLLGVGATVALWVYFKQEMRQQRGGGGMQKMVEMTYGSA